MTKYSLNLPGNKRLDLKLVNKRKIPSKKPFFIKIVGVRKIRNGSKFSRLFRYLFEHINIKKLLGTNLAFFMLASSFLPAYSMPDDYPEESYITKPPTVIETNSSVTQPTNDLKVTQHYSFYHPAIDIDGITGDPVYSIMDGTVAGIQHSRFDYGKAIIIDHGNDMYALYAHLSDTHISFGQKVKAGDTIGSLGATGKAFGDHLHLEIYIGDRTIDPLSIIPLN